MQLNKVLKGLLIMLPVLAVTACSSSDDAVKASGNETNQTSQSLPAESTDTTTVVSPVSESGQLSEEQLKEKVMQNKTVFFAFDNATVSPNYDDMLAAHAAYLSQHPDMKVTIEGHTDERGTPEYNIALGERRAEAVSKYLQAMGVLPNQISIVSYGEEKPLVQGHTEAAYAKNRRAVIVY
jgi:peptidoglycan-associated lipoprotein